MTWRAVKCFDKTMELKVESRMFYLCPSEYYTSLNNLLCGKVCGRLQWCRYKCFTSLEGPVCWWSFAFILGEGNVWERERDI